MTISIVNQKGGVGKTTVAVQLGYALSLQKRVLIVDLDSQAHASRWLIGKEGNGTEQLLQGKGPTSIDTGRENLFLAASSENLNAYNRYETHEVFKKSIDQITQIEKIDIVLIDHPADFGDLSLAGLMAADHALIPVALDVLSSYGTESILKAIGLVSKARGRALPYHFIPNRLLDSKRLPRKVLEDLRANFSGLILTPIRESAGLQEAPIHTKTAFELKESKPSDDFTQLALLLVAKLGI